MCTQTGAEPANTSKKEEIDSRCIVRFRPGIFWKGEYGFDWYRRGDAEEFFNHKTNKSNYFDLVGKYIPKVNYNGPQNPFERFAIYNKSTDSAHKDNHQNHQNDCLHKFCNEYEHREIKGKSKNYFVPVLSLFYKNSAVRREDWGLTTAHIKILKESDSNYILSFIHDPDITIAFSNKRREGNYNVEDVTISCDFTSINTEKTTRTIEVRAKKNSNERGTLAGLLNIIFCKVKMVNVCMVPVLIRRNGNQTTPPPDPSTLVKEEARIKRALAQAHIIPKIEHRPIFIEEGQINNFIVRNILHINDALFELLLQSFIDSLVQDHITSRRINVDNNQRRRYFEYYRHLYSKTYKLFFIDKSGGRTAGMAHAYENNSGELIFLKEAIILQNNDPATVPHEFFHCLGLEHTFENSNTHTFKKKETSNIMDYSFGGFSLWQWQCEQLRSNTALRDIITNDFRIH